MDNWNPTDAALNTLGFDPTGVRQGTQGWSGATGTDPTGTRTGQTGIGFDPTGTDQWQFGDMGRMWNDPTLGKGFDPLMDLALPLMNADLVRSRAAYEAANPDFFAETGAQGGQSWTPSASLGGDWAGVDQWTSAITMAAAKFGVPANLLKAMMKLESNGVNLPPNSSTAVGPMQVTTSNWSGLGYDLYDPAQNIMAGADILKQMYQQMGSWEGAVRAYFAGPGGAYTGNQDSFGTNPTTYWNTVNGYWNTLNAGTGAAGLGNNPGAAGGGWDTMFGGVGVPDWGEFAAESGNGFYGYGTEYGLSGTQHTGVDVPMPLGTAYRAPAAGTVTCAGTNNGPGSNGGGCAAFGDPIGGGVGRVELLLDNGTILIFGHSNRSAFQPGARVNAGDILGWSGGMVSEHIHLEARVPDASMPSGYRIVDPRTVLGGGSGGSYQTGMVGAAQPQAPESMNDVMISLLTKPGYKAPWQR